MKSGNLEPAPIFPQTKNGLVPWKTEAAKTRLGLQVLNDQIAHSNGANNLIGGGGGVLQVARALTLVKHFGDSALDVICCLAHIKAVTQHHANRHDLSQGIRDALARDIGALPWLGSYRATPSPKEALASMPSEPVI